MVAKVEGGKVILYSRNGQIISRNYMEVAKAFEAVKGNAIIDGELVAIGKDGVSHFQLLQNALRHKAKLKYFAFDLMFKDKARKEDGWAGESHSGWFFNFGCPLLGF